MNFGHAEQFEEWSDGMRFIWENVSEPVGNSGFYYADTSFFVSSYARDENSRLAEACLSKLYGPLAFTPIIYIEFLNAMRGRIRRCRDLRKHCPSKREVFAAMSRDLSAGILQRMNPGLLAICSEATTLGRRTEERRVGSYDLLHIASAVLLKPISFLTFDLEQKEFAKAVGLDVWEF